MSQLQTNQANLSEFPEPDALTLALRDRLPEFGRVDWVGTTGSTNADLMQRARAPSRPPALPWLLGAHIQTAGRGRAGRTWQNAEAAALMFSCAFETTIPLAQLPGLSPALGVAACEALRGQSTSCSDDRRRRLGVKWPNDLQWGDAKLAGILVETARHPDMSGPIIIVGMGLNLSGAATLTQRLGRPIADWDQVCPRPTSTRVTDAPIAHRQTVIQLISCVALAWKQALVDYAQQGFAGFQTRYDEVDVLAGQAVNVTDLGQILQTGVAQGTDTMGRLLLTTEQGQAPILVGDVSVRLRAPLIPPAGPAAKVAGASNADSNTESS